MLYETDSFSTTDLTSRVKVGSYTATRDGWYAVGLEIPSGLDATELTTLKLDLAVDEGSGERQDVHMADPKRDDADTSYLRRHLHTFWLNSGDVAHLYIESTNSGDTSVSGSVLWLSADAADMRRINGALADGSPALADRPELHLRQLDLETDTGSALRAVSADGRGLYVEGNPSGGEIQGGSGKGLVLVGGNTGLEAQGGSYGASLLGPTSDLQLSGVGFPIGDLADASLPIRAVDGSGNALATAAALASLAARFTGITSLAHWLRAAWRGDAPDATALGEINDGGGTYDASTDSQEAIRDRVNTRASQSSLDDLQSDVDNLAGSGAVDGLTREQFEQIQLALAAGKKTLTDNGDGTKTLAIYLQDEATVALNLTFNLKGEQTATEVFPA